MRGPAQRTVELERFAYALLAASHPMNLRQLHYAVFSAAVIAYQNGKSDYRRLGRILTEARRAGRILYEWIVDETREAEMVSTWLNLRSYFEAFQTSYRRNYWQDQPRYVEVWCEKASVLNSCRPVTQKYGMTLRTCRGFGSATMEGEIGQLFAQIDKPIHVLYIGDHDPSGHCIEQDIQRRVERVAGKAFHIVRVAIHAEDIAGFNLPPQRIKPTDSRAAAFRKRFGQNAPTVEVEALPVEELRQRLDQQIAGLIDRVRWQRSSIAEEAEQETIDRIAENL